MKLNSRSDSVLFVLQQGVIDFYVGKFLYSNEIKVIFLTLFSDFILKSVLLGCRVFCVFSLRILGV